jgi:hypothetical protein
LNVQCKFSWLLKFQFLFYTQRRFQYGPYVQVMDGYKYERGTLVER